MNIVLIVDGTHTLVNIVTVDSTRANFLLQVAFYQGVVAMIATQVKTVSYHDQHLEDDFCWNQYTLSLVSFIPWIDYMRTFSMHGIFRTNLGICKFFYFIFLNKFVPLW
jgi:hypothetical protein